MELLFDIINLIDTHLIRGISISVLIIILTRKIFPKSDTQAAITIIKWLLIAYSIAIVFMFLLSFLRLAGSNENFIFWDRITGPYWYAYWIMLAGNVFPFLLFIKKLNNNVYFILLIAILVNVGWLLESFIVHIACIRRGEFCFPYDRELIIILEGILLGVLTLIIGNLIALKKKRHKK
jgi:hypothetical protein